MEITHTLQEQIHVVFLNPLIPNKMVSLFSGSHQSSPTHFGMTAVAVSLKDLMGGLKGLTSSVVPKFQANNLRLYVKQKTR